MKWIRICAFASLFLMSGNLFAFQQAASWQEWLNQEGIVMKAAVQQYEYERYNLMTHRTETALKENVTEWQDGPNTWKVETQVKEVTEGQADFTFTFTLVKGRAPQSAVLVTMETSPWSTRNYVLFPGAVYNGNRFASRKIPYSPKLMDPRDVGPDKPTIISDVPRLQIGDGPSRIQERSGSMSTPSMGFQAPDRQKGFFLFTGQGNQLGDYGMGIEESRDRKKATFYVSSPIVRELYKYRITDSQWPSDDRAYDFREGESVSISFRLCFFPAPNLQDLFDFFATNRKSYLNNGQLASVVPFSSAFQVQERKFNQYNFVPEHGYYSVGLRENFLQDWQIGWTGGMITTYPLLFAGNQQTRQNVLRNFDWLFPNGISPSGYFWDSGEKGTIWYGGDIRKYNTKDWHLIRKSADGLYFVVKQFMLMEKMGIEVKPVWKEGTIRVAEAFMRTWKKYGQLGQFVDSQTGDVAVGGSSSGAIAPAALALASQYFQQPAWLDTARSMARYYHREFVLKGFSTGGPGDALQNPDSESAYALVETFATLYEITGERAFLEMGEQAARQFATWVMSYNYRFPETSLFGRRNAYSLGGVIANTQNKHGAPGICTHSGIGLLKLFRATGNPFYAELLQEIAHNIPQYLSYPGREITGGTDGKKAELGWICERVSTTDWLEGIGEISYLTTWAETALLLTTVEVPGLYIRPETGLVVAFDNVRARVVDSKGSNLMVEVENPTASPASVRMLTEYGQDISRPLGENALWNAPVVSLAPGETRVLRIPKRKR